MIVCHCAVVSDREVGEAIRNGATDVCALAEVCGTSRSCGGCLPALRQALCAHGLSADDDWDAPSIRTIMRDRAAMRRATGVLATA